MPEHHHFTFCRTTACGGGAQAAYKKYVSLPLADLGLVTLTNKSGYADWCWHGAAMFHFLSGVVLASSGKLYGTDGGNNRISRQYFMVTQGIGGSYTTAIGEEAFSRGIINTSSLAAYGSTEVGLTNTMVMLTLARNARNFSQTVPDFEYQIGF